MTAESASDSKRVSPEGIYEARRIELQAAVDDLERRSNRLSLARGLSFLLTLGAVGAALVGRGGRLHTIAALSAVSIFIALVVAHALLLTKKTEAEGRLRFVVRGLERLRGDHAGSESGAEFTQALHAYAGDLDIFGKASLFQFVSTAVTGVGRATLAEWLLDPGRAADVAARQRAAQEIAEKHRFREDLAAEATRSTSHRSAAPKKPFVEGSTADGNARDGRPRLVEKTIDGILAWTEGPPLFDEGAKRLAGVARIFVAVTMGSLIVLELPFAQHLGLLRHVWILPLVLQYAILLKLRGAIDPVIAVITSREAPMGDYLGVLERIEGEPAESPLFRELRESIAGSSGKDASTEMRRLRKIVGYAELRHNGLVHFFANAFLLWDVWCAVALDGWRGRAGRLARGWIVSLGRIEALASIATMAFEHPEFAWPEVTEGQPHFEATELGHPLIPQGRRVSNDVHLPKPGTALMVTGSNMSGKSTLLRTVGVNAVLAFAGAPVCATRARMAVMRVRTSMRISDSLELGVSHFYAELERLKGVVDAADRHPDVLFLLDEILHGTNSRERILGAKAILLHLVSTGAIGLVSSHDLGLVSLEAESGGSVVNVHFEELIDGGLMTFDYKLKPGVVQTANALRLMKLVGIAVDFPTDEEAAHGTT